MPWPSHWVPADRRSCCSRVRSQRWTVTTCRSSTAPSCRLFSFARRSVRTPKAVSKSYVLQKLAMNVTCSAQRVSTAPYPPNMAGARDTDSLLFSDPVAMIRAGVLFVPHFPMRGPTEVSGRTLCTREGRSARAVRVRFGYRNVDDFGRVDKYARSTELPARCTWARTVAECPAWRA